MAITLIAESGPARGQALEVVSKLFIGRDAHCQVRPQLPELAGIHTLVEMRDGHAFVRDCDTTLGTTINDRVIHSTEVAVFDGDRLAIGDLSFVLRISPRELLNVSLVHDVPDGWPLVLAPTASTVHEVVHPVPSVGVLPETTAPEGSLTYEVPPPGKVLLIRPLAADLNDETTVSPLRSDLLAIAELGLPRWVVIDLGKVNYLSSRAVGVLLATYQRIDREGGLLRVSRVHPNVLPVLQQMRLDRLADLFTTVECALEADWE